MTNSPFLQPPDGVFPVERLERGRPEARSDGWASDPAPFEDELLSSWLSRQAWANAMGPDAFLSNLRSAIGQSGGDLDQNGPDRLLDALSQRTGLPRQRLKQLRWFGSDKPLLTGFLCPLRFCPHCWKEDAAPYARWHWRAAPVRLCQRHELWLCHRCPKCLSSISILSGKRRRPLYQCAICNYDLRKSEAAYASSDAVCVQSLVGDLLDILCASEGEDEFNNISATILSIGRNLQSSQRQEERFSLIQKGIGERPQTIDGSPAGLYTLLDTLSPGKARQQLLHRYCGIGHPFKVDVDGVPLHTSADTIDEKIYSPERGEAVAIVMMPPTAFLLDLLKNVRCVRPAIQADIPLIRKFFSNHLSCHFENHSPRANSNYWDSVESLIDFRWKSVFEGRNPIVVGVSDDAVVGVAMVWAERLVEIFIDPTNEIHFFPALLRGIVEHSARLGLSHVEAEVSRTDGLLFELAGWNRPNRATPSARWHLSLSSPLRVNNRTSYSSPDAPVDRP
ncbi:hypothetical protein CRT60_03440 [Azospirillum palustre]|uniref:TniQ domain-containing protein n=1 Tax=Azospirillum palustre TaxID=2044885 RepID=A0A2B8BMR1_9PROT|nr:TniQ family protein [Azospirillum palustre]PGH59145.1 hypothetical protein CRT60_03440 [Azospirillum palustre]